MSSSQRKKLAALTREIQGDLIFSRYDHAAKRDGIYRIKLGAYSARRLTDHGRYPRWSPDARKIAFIRDNQIMMMDANGRSERKLADAEFAHAISFHPNGRDVLYTDIDGIRKVSVTGGESELIIPGKRFFAVAMARNQKRMIVVESYRRGEHHLNGHDLEAGTVHYIDDGCSASFAPDSEHFLDLEGMHREILVRTWSDWKNYKDRMKGPGYHTIDNDYWSNHSNWIATRTELPGKQDVWLLSFPSGRRIQVTAFGDCDRPDLFVRSGF